MQKVSIFLKKEKGRQTFAKWWLWGIKTSNKTNYGRLNAKSEMGMRLPYVRYIWFLELIFK